MLRLGGMLHAADEEGVAEEQGGQPSVLQHDDDIGEEVPWGQMQMICDCIVRLVWPSLAFILRSCIPDPSFGSCSKPHQG